MNLHMTHQPHVQVVAKNYDSGIWILVRTSEIIRGYVMYIYVLDLCTKWKAPLCLTHLF